MSTLGDATDRKVARTVAAMALESLVRSRTDFPLWTSGIVAVAGIVAGVAIGGLLGGVLLLVGVLDVPLFFVIASGRAAALTATRRLVGGVDYELTKALLDKYRGEVRMLVGALPLSRVGLVKLVLRVRKPAAVLEEIMGAVDDASVRIPGLLNEVRQAVAGDSPRLPEDGEP